ncbi:ureidoglycolate lyase [Algicella marina]|uniref:Ureidoglycolate hydrolase n=1 Tax=Algicella marina TaxID=2683284 RepID=A0A6P1T7T8_9RHOB|nr:ureidoglycolate lyase [Algicella marina]QHQ36652.1 Ureidoglycolate hydrolase [Algicella marina]
MTVLTAQPLTAGAFAPFGDVIEAAGEADRLINDGKCGRYHALAHADCADGAVGLNIFRGTAYATPLRPKLVERHPLGSQAFMPLSPEPFVVLVAEDDGGLPGTLHAFLTASGQGVNYHRNVWHGVLCPLVPQDFLVVDYVGDAPNLEEYEFTDPPEIRLPRRPAGDGP